MEVLSVGLTNKSKRVVSLHLCQYRRRTIHHLDHDPVDVLYIETPTNPLMLEFDIAYLAKIGPCKGAKVVVDNTFYSPIYQRPIEEGADIVLHSATKVPSWSQRCLAGVVVTNDADLYDKLFTI